MGGLRISVDLPFTRRLAIATVAIACSQAAVTQLEAQELDPLATGQPLVSSPMPPLLIQPGQPYAGLPMPPPAPSSDSNAPAQADAAPGAEPAATPAPPAWQVTPYASLREAYTDNARLTPHGTPDLVTSASPGASVTGNTRRLQLALDGNVTYDAYARASDLNGYRYNFYGNGLGEIVENYLFIDARSSISAEPVNSNAGVSAFDRSLPGNQVQVINNSISPYLAHDFAGWASGELRYRESALDYSAANTNSQAQTVTPTGPASIDLSNSVTNEVSANLRAGPRFTTFRWAFDGSSSTSDYTDHRTVEQNSSTVTGEYAAMRELALLAKLGVDTFKDSAVSQSDQVNGSWRVGARVTPGPRTDLLLEGGERYGGPYWSGEFRYRVSQTLTLSATHNETVGTQQQLSNDSLNQLVRDNQGRLADPLTGEVIDPNATPFGFSGQSFSLKTSRIALSGVDGRNSYDVSVEYDERALGAISLAQGGSERQDVLLAAGSVGRQLTHVSDITVSFSAGQTHDSIGANSYNIWQGGIAYDHDLSPTLKGTLGYRHYTLTNPVGTGYGENALLASIRKSF